MKTYFSILFAMISLNMGSIIAQDLPLLNISLCPGPNYFYLIVTPNGSFDGIPSNIHFTIKCNSFADYLYVSPLVSFLTIEKAGPTHIVNNGSYQKFVLMGIDNLQAFNYSWAATQPDTIANISPLDMSLTYSIQNDSWTNENNGDYYAELNGFNRTGIIDNSCNTVLHIVHLEGKATSEGNSLLLTTSSISEIDHFQK